MGTCWDEPLAAMTARAEGWAGVWTIAYTIGMGVQRVAAVDGWDDDLALTYAGMDVALAVSELEWANPTGTAAAIEVGLGAATPERAQALHRLCFLINDAIILIATLAVDSASTPRQINTGLRAWALLHQAQVTLAGSRS